MAAAPHFIMETQTVLDHFVDWLPFLASLLVVIGGWYLGRSSQKADIATKIADAAGKLIDPLKERIEELERVVRTQEKELILLRPLPQIVAIMTRGVHILIDQLRKNNIVPEWTPADMTVPLKPKRNGRG